jgi:SAM-dependent methyltransferase
LSSSSRRREAVRQRARRAGDAARDLADAVSGRRDPLVPPRRLLGDDFSEFERIGEEFLGYFTDIGGLERDHRVLDIGCGVGRMAVPLTRHLSAAGSYEGFDVAPREIDWCRDAITPRHPNFQFRVLDVRNERYNPDGQPASSVGWPYDDASFDFAIATSVFTHLRPADAEAYLAEAGRVLRPGGTLFATWFLLDDVTRALIAGGDSYFTFEHADGPAAAEDPNSFEAAVAYDVDWVRDRHAAGSLTPAEPRRGYWSGAEPHLTWQDVLVARRD